MREASGSVERTVATPTDERVTTESEPPAWASAEAPPTSEEAPDVVPGFGRPPADPRSFVGPERTPARGVRREPVPSVAAIAGHPLHPMVVPLPIGALTLALASDLAYARSGDHFWARASKALIGTGMATGALAGLLGATDFLGRERIREHPEAWLHAGGNLVALGLSAASLLARQRDARATVPLGLGLSMLTGTLLLLTGWLGGELSYRHRIGVVPD